MNKGFTLIELLAVIVILAIIALIATPIVLNIINDTKESAVLRSAEYYLNSVENSIMKKNMNSGGSFSPNTCVVQSDGKLLCDGTETLELEISGEVPSTGTITFNKGKIVDVELTLSNKNIIKNSNGELAYYVSPCTRVTGDKDTPGSLYECEVKEGTKYNFYVLSLNDDGTTNLIMDRNICEDVTPTEEGKTCLVEWQTSGKNADGPVTAMNFLYNATKDWTNISNIEMNYTDEGNNYGSIKTTGNKTQITKKEEIETATYENLKARMPRYDEVHGTGKCLTYEENGNKYGSCPLWLSNYLNISSYVTGEGLQNISGIYGYWTLSSFASDSSTAWDVHYRGGVGDSDVVDDYDNGVRPVITLEI